MRSRLRRCGMPPMRACDAQPAQQPAPLLDAPARTAFSHRVPKQVPWCASICAAIATGATDAQWICSTVDLCKAPRGDDDWRRLEEDEELPALRGATA